MATYTSNLNLKKPGLSDDALIADINGNMDLLDTDAGKLRADIAIVENGNTATHNIAEGQYVVWKGDLCIASAAIASGATLSSSNLTAKPNGLGGEITSLSDHIGNVGSTDLQTQINNVSGRAFTDLNGAFNLRIIPIGEHSVTGLDSWQILWRYLSSNFGLQFGRTCGAYYINGTLFPF